MALTDQLVAAGIGIVGDMTFTRQIASAGPRGPIAPYAQTSPDWRFGQITGSATSLAAVCNKILGYFLNSGSATYVQPYDGNYHYISGIAYPEGTLPGLTKATFYGVTYSYYQYNVYHATYLPFYTAPSRFTDNTTRAIQAGDYISSSLWTRGAQVETANVYLVTRQYIGCTITVSSDTPSYRYPETLPAYQKPIDKNTSITFTKTGVDDTKRWVGWFKSTDGINYTLISQADSFTLDGSTVSADTYIKGVAEEVVNILISTAASPAEGGTVTLSGGGTSGTYEMGEDCTVVATPANGFSFDGWDNDRSNKSTTLTFTVSAQVTRIGYFARNNYPVTILSNGNGTVSFDGRKYGSEYTAEVPFGTAIPIYVRAAQGYKFKQWTASSGTIPSLVSGNAYTYTLGMTSNVTLTATFAFIHTITAQVAEGQGGRGTVTGGGTAVEGETVTLTAYAELGYDFQAWYANGLQVSTSATYDYICGDADATLTATFTPHEYTIPVSVSPAMTPPIGVVEKPNSSGGYDSVTQIVAAFGTSFRLRARITDYESESDDGHDLGYDFLQWMDGNQNADRYFTIDRAFVEAGYTTSGIVATFTDSVRLRLSIEGRGTVAATLVESDAGDDAPPGYFPFGSTVQLTATPATGWDFVTWRKADGTESTSAQTTITVGYGYTTAVFARKMVEISTAVQFVPAPFDDSEAGESESEGGEPGSVTGGGTYEFGSSVTLTAVPAPGYAFIMWADGPADNPRSVSVGAEPATYTAIFSNGVSIAATALGNGTVDGIGVYRVGELVTLTAVPRPGARFIKWLSGATSATLSFAASAPATYTAVFANAETQVFVPYVTSLDRRAWRDNQGNAHIDDIAVDDAGGISRVYGKNAYAQILEAIIKTQRGEIILDLQRGVPYRETIFVSAAYRAQWEREVLAAIEACPFVQSIISSEFTYGQSTAHYSVTVQTDDGEVSVNG